MVSRTLIICMRGYVSGTLDIGMRGPRPRRYYSSLELVSSFVRYRLPGLLKLLLCYESCHGLISSCLTGAVTRIERKKKGQRLVFDSKCPGQIPVLDTCTSKENVPPYVNIQPSLPTQSAPVPEVSYSSVLPSTLPPIMQDVATQTLKSNSLCGPFTKNSTCVKVSIISVFHENIQQVKL